MQNIKSKGGANMIKISEAEFEVMKIIWQRKQATSLEIIEDLQDHNWNFNTVRTLIKRLETKGAIKIIEQKGKVYTYMATIDENEFKRKSAKDLFKKLYDNSMNEFILKYGKVTAEDIQNKIDYIEAREEKEKKETQEKNKNK